ncbi:MAG: threonylcarbamoyl-AMP synthase [Candidatus Tectimicrobiota bacterium]|nr:MAG: threonylcarbamoyl-AMP synthase [Candidatus Tectomicrobia bacterium]
MAVVPATTETLARAAALLREGQLVAFPTETVYGLGADAGNVQAVARLFAVKRRPAFDPLIVHLAAPAWVETVCQDVDVRARRLMAAFWPGPLTLVLPKRDTVPDLVTAGLPTVAVRMPAHPVALALISQAGRPIAAPSANPFGYLSPTTAEHVYAQLGEEVALILDGGPCPVGVESTILDLSGPEPELLRAGGVPVEELARVLGAPPRLPQESSDARPRAPGRLPHHYAPRTPLRLLPAGASLPPPAGKRVGLLAFRPPASLPRGYACLEVLSPRGDLQEAAANLFAALHRLDRAGLDLILAEPVPAEGLGRAINERLRKAAAS